MKKCHIKVLMIILVASMFLISCITTGTAGNDITVTPEITAALTQMPLVTPDARPTSAPETTGNVKPKELRPLQFYTINESTQEKEATTALISSQDVVTPEYILLLVVEAMDEIGIDVVIDAIEIDDDTVHISFSESSAFLTTVSSELEIEILDAVAQSVLDNFAEYSKVIFQIEGKAYSTANFQFDDEYIYLERK